MKNPSIVLVRKFWSKKQQQDTECWIISGKVKLFLVLRQDFGGSNKKLRANSELREYTLRMRKNQETDGYVRKNLSKAHSIQSTSK